MRRESFIRVLAGALLALFASVAVTLPIHLSSVDHLTGACETTAGNDAGCLFLQFLTEAYTSGDDTPEVTPPTVSAEEPLQLESALLEIDPISLPALRAPPFLYVV